MAPPTVPDVVSEAGRQNYAKRKRKQTANTSVAPVINTLSAGIFEN
jgi:hypothetical protein